MRTFLLYLAFILTFSVFIYGALKQYAEGKEGLKFDSQNVREIWQACSMQFKMISPYMPQETRMYLCDCYSDYMRTTFTPKQVKELKSEESKKLGTKLKTLCPIPSPQPTIDT